MRQVEALHESPGLGVFDVRCFSPSGPPGSEEYAEATQVVLPTQGVFEVHHGDDAVVADVASAVVLRAGREYRVGHPLVGGDRSTVLVFAPGVLEDALDPDGRPGGPVGSRVHLGLWVLGSDLRRRAIGQLEAEELALLLLGQIGVDLARASLPTARGRHQRDRIERVRTLLASDPGRRWRLAEIASLVHCSPFHLARQFRAIGGEPISKYLLRLRLALALQRLAEGEADLARLAADLGFTSHSHFSARFRSIFGVSPRSIRVSLTAGRAAELRTILTARDRAAS